jgi:hypothetical protein
MLFVCYDNQLLSIATRYNNYSISNIRIAFFPCQKKKKNSSFVYLGKKIPHRPKYNPTKIYLPTKKQHFLSHKNKMSTVPPTPPPAAAVAAAAASNIRIPSDETLRQAAKLGVIEDRPVMFDYWTGSIDKSVLIGVKDDESKEKMLVRSEEEYTSPIQRIFKVGNEYIVMTENSIYVVDAKIPTKKISA